MQSCRECLYGGDCHVEARRCCMRDAMEQLRRGDPVGFRRRDDPRMGCQTSLCMGWFGRVNLFPGVVADGVWTIDVSPSVAGEADPSPSVQVISPTIGYDSGLFDRVRVRLRTVHHRPTVGSLWLSWTNEHNRTAPGQDPADLFGSRFGLVDASASSIRPNGRKWR